MKSNSDKKKNSYKFFRNNECEYFPCHKCSENDIEDFNCLFCYCPLYKYNKCGGNFKYLENGCKDCSDCKVPHKKDNYEYMIKKIQEFYNFKDLNV